MGELDESPTRLDASAPVASTEAESAAIAIVGMAGRFPGAPDIDVFWRKLCAGEECLTRFTAAELLEAGIPRALVEDPSYVPVNGTLSDIEQFDASFFAMNPREASITDPQHRIFLELAWHALEHSGRDAACLHVLENLAIEVRDNETVDDDRLFVDGRHTSSPLRRPRQI